MGYGVISAQASSDDTRDDEHEHEYQGLLDALLSSGNVMDLSIRNSWLTSILTAVSFNTWFCAQNVETRGFHMQKLVCVMNVIIVLLLRWYNGRYWVLPIVILSLWALKCHVPTPSWSIFGK